MSNSKLAFGWSGHILVSADESESDTKDNVVSVPQGTFDQLRVDYENCELDGRIKVERLGVIDSDYYFLAVGSPVSFSEGYRNFGTIFKEAELQAERQPLSVNHDAEYIAAMKEIYGIELPPCRLMIGCNSEH